MEVSLPFEHFLEINRKVVEALGLHGRIAQKGTSQIGVCVPSCWDLA